MKLASINTWVTQISFRKLQVFVPCAFYRTVYSLPMASSKIVALCLRQTFRLVFFYLDIIFYAVIVIVINVVTISLYNFAMYWVYILKIPFF